MAPDAETALDEIDAGWVAWSSRCLYQGEFRDQVVRSLLTLKALTYYPTGGIVAAPTTSLPELPGGQRNWDYRYCWLRDATFTLLALMHGGYREEAQAWGAWLRRSVAGTPSQIQTLYGLAGERWLMEWEVPWLTGYDGARPVRIGNAASAQLQLDVYGELMDALYQEMHLGLARPRASWDIQRALVTHLAGIWDQPDESIWEVRGGQRHFTFSKVMAWVAMDRAIRGAEEFGMPGRLEQWRALRQTIHDSVCREGWNAEKGSFVQYYGGDALDASLLLMPLVGFLPPEDPRIKGTVAAIQRELTIDGLVLRYRTHEHVDGLPPGEGRVPRVQLLAGRQPYPAGTQARGARAVRAAAGPVQRCRAAGGRVRSAHRSASGQLPAGVLTPGADQHGDEPAQPRSGAPAARRLTPRVHGSYIVLS